MAPIGAFAGIGDFSWYHVAFCPQSHAFGISGVDMGIFSLMGVPVFGRWEIFGKRYASFVPA